MLNFDKMRGITEKMKSDSYIYTENFLQKIFDNTYFYEGGIYVNYNEAVPEYFPDDADPDSLFEDISFHFEYDYSGILRVLFFPNRLKETEDCKFLSIQEVLLNNGFIQEEDENIIVFTRKI